MSIPNKQKIISANNLIIVENEQRVYDAGYERGKAEGGDTTAAYEQGYTEGKKEGYEQGFYDGIPAGYDLGVNQGKKSEYDAFWDSFQQEGARTDYKMAFRSAGWSDTNFKPKYDIKPVGDAGGIFTNSAITDLKGIFEAQGITFDFSQVTYSNNTFDKSKITRLPVMDLSNLPNCSSVFNSANALVWVDGIILNPEGGQNFGSSAGYNWVLYSAISHLPILSGVISTNCWAKLDSLDKESIESFFSALSDTTSGLSMTFSKKAKEAAFTEDEWATLIATKPNWAINLV